MQINDAVFELAKRVLNSFMNREMSTQYRVGGVKQRCVARVKGGDDKAIE